MSVSLTLEPERLQKFIDGLYGVDRLIECLQDMVKSEEGLADCLMRRRQVRYLAQLFEGALADADEKVLLAASDAPEAVAAAAAPPAAGAGVCEWQGCNRKLTPAQVKYSEEHFRGRLCKEHQARNIELRERAAERERQKAAKRAKESDDEALL